MLPNVGGYVRFLSPATLRLVPNKNYITTRDAQIASPTCGACGTTLSRPFVCLQCSYTACWMEEHIHDHLRDAGHSFCKSANQPAPHTPDSAFRALSLFLLCHSPGYLHADMLIMYDAGIDTRTGSFFCTECDDFVYDQSFTSVYSSVNEYAGVKQTPFRGRVSSCFASNERLI